MITNISIKNTKVFLSLITILVLCGCTTVETIRTAPEEEGVSEIYEYPYEKVFDATLRVVSSLPLNIEFQSKEQGLILMGKGASLFSWGERVRILIKGLESTKTKVTVLSKRALATNITAKNWTSDIFENISAELSR